MSGENEKIIADLTKDLESQLRTEEPDEFQDAVSEVDDHKNDISDGDVDESEDEDERLRELESLLSEEEKQEKKKLVVELKEEGNEFFRSGDYTLAYKSYSKALKCCPISFAVERSMLYNNRAATKVKQGNKESAVKDCTKAIELNPPYVKALKRRAGLYEELEQFDRALSDYEELKMFEPLNRIVIDALRDLPGKRDEQNEKLKKEMFGKLKELGNTVLKPFGLSTDNFLVNQDPSTGSYSFSFKK